MNKVSGSLSLEDIQDIYEQSAAHWKDGDIKENFGMVAILDVLGWKKRADEQSIQVYVGLINKLRWRMYDTYKRCVEDKNIVPNFTITTLSDTIAILVNGSFPYCEINIFNHISAFLEEALEQGFMFRGAISRGKYFTNNLDNVFVGEPFFEATKYAEATDWAGVIITDSLSTALLEKNTIEDLQRISIIKYDNIPFKKGIDPCKDKLVLVPQNERRVFYSSTIARLDFKTLYKKFMGDEIVKYKNTATFIEYVERTYWAENKDEIDKRLSKDV